MDKYTLEITTGISDPPIATGEIECNSPELMVDLEILFNEVGMTRQVGGQTKALRMHINQAL